MKHVSCETAGTDRIKPRVPIKSAYQYISYTFGVHFSGQNALIECDNTFGRYL